MIDNNPHFNTDYNALCSELREMREQQEQFYFRDVDRKFEECESTKKKNKKKTLQQEMAGELSALNAYDLNANLIGSVKNPDLLRRESNDSIVTIIAILVFGSLVAIATYFLTH